MNKKFLVTVVSSTCLAATLLLAPTVEASGGPSADNTSQGDYTVQPGDTLSQIALENNTSVSQLKEANQLDTDLIYVGQNLHTNSNANTSENSSNNTSEQDNTSTDVIEIDESDSNNNINTETNATANGMVSVAESKVGADYAWGASGPNAFDSSGFVNYVLEQNDVNPSRTHADMWANDGEHVSQPEPGDVVFFENTYESPDRVTHSGIYLGGNQMVHAGTTATGVEITPASDWNYYWSEHYIGAKRF